MSESPVLKVRLWPIWLCLALLTFIVGFGAYLHLMKPPALPPVVQPSAELQSLRRELADQQRALEELEQHRQTPAQNQQAAIDALAQQVQALQEALEAAQTHQSDEVQLLLAFNQLSRAMKAGKPFVAEWEAFEQASASFVELDAAKQSLADYAEDGIASLGWLKDDFKKALRAPDLPKEAALLEQVEHNLSSLVTVRKVGKEHSGKDAESRIARAEYALGQGDVAEALSEIGELPKDRRKAFADWRDEAAWRVDGLAALEALRLAVEHAAQGSTP